MFLKGWKKDIIVNVETIKQEKEEDRLDIGKDSEGEIHIRV